MSDLKKVSRALISVSDKTGIVDFARALTGQGVEILSTGGTFRLLKDKLSLRPKSLTTLASQK